MTPFKVDPKDAVEFSKVWKFKGLSMPLSDVHTQFATDFANIAIRSFIEFTMAQAKARQEQELAKATLLVTEK